MKDYTILPDEELSTLAKINDDYAAEVLLRRYKNLVIKCTRPYYIIGQEQDDLIQEGMIGLHNAVLSFNVGGAKFITYATRCVKSRIIDALKSSSATKHMPLNNYAPLLSSEGNEEHHHSMITQSPERLAEDLERDSELLVNIKTSLSGKEVEVFNRFLDGMKISDIATDLAFSYKGVDNTLQRIRKKIKAILTDGNS